MKFPTFFIFFLLILLNSSSPPCITQKVLYMYMVYMNIYICIPKDCSANGRGSSFSGLELRVSNEWQAMASTVSPSRMLSRSNTSLAFGARIVCILAVVHIVRPHPDYMRHRLWWVLCVSKNSIIVLLLNWYMYSTCLQYEVVSTTCSFGGEY